MIINVDRLRKLGACGDGIKVFAEAYPEGLDVSRWDAAFQLGVLMHPKCRRYLGWAWTHGLLPRLPMAGWNLGGADLYGADLRGADLRGVDLRGVDLRGANLRGTDLSGADLRGADLRGANLSGADLIGADLIGAFLYGADLSGADLSEAKWDERIPPAGWRVNAEGKLER